MDQTVQLPKLITANLEKEARSYIYKLMKGKGVLSLASSWDSILMWSYYSDCHRGICIEYDLSSNQTKNMFPVKYESNRQLNFSDFRSWLLCGTEEARQNIYAKFYYAKSDEWKHEGEYRDVSEHPGVICTPYDISAIYFGAKCPEAVMALISSLFHGGEVNVSLYKVAIPEDNNKLRREKLSEEEILWRKPKRRGQSYFEMCLRKTTM